MTKNKKLYIIGICGLIIANLLEFLMLFIPSYVLEIDIGYAEYVRIFLNKLIEVSIPTLGAILMFAIGGGWKFALSGALGLAMTRIIYLVPYFYLYFIEPTNVGYLYDSTEAILLALLVSLFGALLLFGQIVLFYYVIRLLAKFSARKPIIAALPPKQRESLDKKDKAKINLQADKIIDESSDVGNIFDLSSPLPLGIFSAVFIQFAISLVSEIFGTVEFLIEASGSYRTGEIIYIMVCYLFILLELVVLHAIGCQIVKAARKEGLDE